MATPKHKNHWSFVRNFFLPHKDNRRHPHLLRYEVIGAVLLLMLAVEGFSVLQTVDLQSSSNQLGAVLPAVVIDLTNQNRSSDNLSTLAPNPVLAEAAQDVANDLATQGYFAHVSPQGKTPWDWLKQVGYQYQYAGQNLAVNFGDSQQLMTAWMNSPEHRANILGANFTQIGVGMATGTYQGQQVVFVVQYFASPLQVAAPPADASAASPELAFGTLMMSSPRTSATDVLIAVAIFFALLLVYGLVFSRHPLNARAAFNGVILVAAISGILLLNQQVIFKGVSLPTSSDQSATVFLYHANH